ncbi:MAG: hypothetical protein HY749_14575 [Gammaproteobacteria bacterium]|nr:hypothetical protein [Gammaproteobacteria bacterium]MBI5618464.1 hypothetical protein [Gammaproteobacteria bacterium]
MPFTPLHFGPGAALHSVAPARVSFLAFCAANILVDVEPLYYMLTEQYPIHRFFHTYVGVSIVIVLTVALFVVLPHPARLPNVFGWKDLRPGQIALGALLGGFSHIVLDSVMHEDIRPLAPFSAANVLYQRVSIDTLHVLCLAAGAVGLFVLGVRRISGAATTHPRS